MPASTSDRTVLDNGPGLHRALRARESGPSEIGDATTISALFRLTDLASREISPEEMLPILTEIAVAHAGVDGAAVLRPRRDAGVSVVASSGLPETLCARSFATTVLDPSLGDELLRATDGQFGSQHTLPLANSTGAFGALVLFSREVRMNAADPLAHALADLACIAIGQAERYVDLTRLYREVDASREALMRSHKLSALGQMAAGVAHDLRNILNPLSLYLQRGKVGLEEGDYALVGAAFDRMQVAIRRGVDTVARLSDFARQSPVRGAGPVDLDALTEEAIDIARARIAGHATITIRVELTKPPPVLAHGTDLVSAVANVVINAIDAMENGGTISVSTGSDGRGAWVRVEDDGPGMPPEVERRAFEPFFSTKGDGGSGLGLAIVYAFVQRTGGRVTLRTAPGKGTAITLWFPVSRAGALPA